MPEHFRFTFKLWKGITHSKGFNYKEEDIVKFLKSINSVQSKKGCLLIQFPPGLGKEYIVRLDELLSCIKENDSCVWNIAIEFRNKSWFNESTYKLLNFFKAALVIHDIPKSATPMISHESDLCISAFMGPLEIIVIVIQKIFLSEYSTYVNERVEEGREVYMYFNNTMGDALNNLKTMNGLLHHSESMAQ